MTGKCYLLFVAQTILLWYMVIEATTDEAMLADLYTLPTSNSTVIGRFICAFIMHISLTSETKQGLTMMKYATNHPWKFSDWRQAYLIGFFQVTVLLTCEAGNLIILATNHAMLDIIMNFLAIIVITEFDDYFFYIVQDEVLAGLIADKTM